MNALLTAGVALKQAIVLMSGVVVGLMVLLGSRSVADGWRHRHDRAGVIAGSYGLIAFGVSGLVFTVMQGVVGEVEIPPSFRALVYTVCLALIAIGAAGIAINYRRVRNERLGAAELPYESGSYGAQLDAIQATGDRTEHAVDTRPSINEDTIRELVELLTARIPAEERAAAVVLRAAAAKLASDAEEI